MEVSLAKFTTQDYGQMLLNGVDNFTATYFSGVIGHVSHDSSTRSIADIKLPPKVLREKDLELVIPSSNGYLALVTYLDTQTQEKTYWLYDTVPARLGDHKTEHPASTGSSAK
jgi:hypothetical protein